MKLILVLACTLLTVCSVVTSVLQTKTIVDLGPAPNKRNKTVVELAVATPDLSMLVSALEAAGLVDTLSGKGPFTVFAPTNEAFAAIPPVVLAQLFKPKYKYLLVNILHYHVAPGDIHAKDLKDMEMISTLEGDGPGQQVTARLSGSDIFINSAKIIAADNDASNGVVHIIDRMLWNL